jgi:tetratricopeptide (TPR) repeat protein
MKTSVVILFVAAVSFCYGQTAPGKDNEELKEIYRTDQSERSTHNINWKTLNKNDSVRMARVYELLRTNKVVTGQDHYHAAMVFQHGSDTVASAMAVNMMRKAIELDTTVNKWLLAAAIDRDLMRRNEPQIYGTQYMKAGDGPWQRYRIDSTKVSDEERKTFGVETLAEQRRKERMMNKTSLAELHATGKTVNEIIALAKTERKKGDASPYNLSESDINMFGYELMNAKKYDDALTIFKLNTDFYANGYNAWDSLGECLLLMGKEKEGLAAYKKSLVLNPKNKNAERILGENRKR